MRPGLEVVMINFSLFLERVGASWDWEGSRDSNALRVSAFGGGWPEIDTSAGNG